MIRGGRGQAKAGKLQEAQRVSHSPGNLPLTGNPFQIAQRQQSKANAMRQSRPADAGGIICSAKLLAKDIKLVDFKIQTFGMSSKKVKITLDI